MKSEFLKIMQERGFIHQCSDLEALDQKLSSQMCSAYIGFDATATSLHVGSLVQIMMLYWFQQSGHRPITLMGGGTTRVGDPSGKDEARKMLTEDDIQNNINGIQSVFAKYLTYGENKNEAVMVNNADWLLEINYIEFLRDYGRHFSVNRMLTFDSVKLRLEREQPLSFLEFNYMILQAYDFVELNRRYDAIMQMGGSDQWGNIINGVDLGRRTLNADMYALTTPLLTTSSGAKMGKTANGAVWLNADMRSPYDFYQFWRNTEDSDVGRFLKLFTTLPMDEIAKLAALQGAEINEAKKVLAYEATRMCHGAEAATQAAETAQATFEQGQMAEGLPTIELASSELESGVPILDLLITTGIVASKSEARRLIKGGGVKINDVRVDDENLVCSQSDIADENAIKISSGKKKHVLVKAA